METTIETNTNEEINVLRIKLEVVEKELQFAIDRAEKAEAELEQFKQFYRSSSTFKKSVENNQNCCACGPTISGIMSTASIITAPPPPPPPMPNFNLPPLTTNSLRSGVSLSEGIAAFTLNNARESGNSSVSNQQVKPATGRYRSTSKVHSYQHIFLHFFSSPTFITNIIFSI